MITGIDVNRNIIYSNNNIVDSHDQILNSIITNRSHFYLNIEDVVSGPFGSTLTSDSYLGAGVPFIRIENIKSGFIINKQSLIYISNHDNERLASSQLVVDDVILSKVGNSIGYFARVDEEIGQCNISENNIGIKLHQYDRITKHYILTYLNTSTANRLILRRKSGNAQPKLNVDDIKYIPIPAISAILKQKISKVVQDASIHIRKALETYDICENNVLSYCQLEAMELENTIGYESTYSKIKNANRWDAEYYQPKYTELFNKMDGIDLMPLNKIVTIQKSIEPGSDMYEDTGIPFVRVSDMSKYGLSEPNIYLDANIFKDVIRPKKDTILLSKDGSVGIAYKVPEDMEVITSGAILHLFIFNGDFLPDYVTLVLNSLVGKMQAERDAGGSVIQHWKPSEIGNVLIPKLDKKIQQEISQQVQQSFELRAESKRLLEVAKRTVEIAIEVNEEKAIQYINDYGKSLYNK